MSGRHITEFLERLRFLGATRQATGLDDDALVAVVGQNAPQVAQQIGKRHPDPRFSALLVKWIKNLTFTGITEPANKQVGRIGVNPQETAA